MGRRWVGVVRYIGRMYFKYFKQVNSIYVLFLWKKKYIYIKLFIRYMLFNFNKLSYFSYLFGSCLFGDEFYRIVLTEYWSF